MRRTEDGRKAKAEEEKMKKTLKTITDRLRKAEADANSARDASK